MENPHQPKVLGSEYSRSRLDIDESRFDDSDRSFPTARSVTPRGMIPDEREESKIFAPGNMNPMIGNSNPYS